MQHNSEMETGTRVGAILSAEEGVVQFLGWGVYQGNVRRPEWREAVERMLPILREIYGEEAREPREVVRDVVVGQLATEAALDGRTEVPESEINERIEREYLRRKKIAGLSDKALRRHVAEHPSLRSAKILLDDGATVWGDECWWGSEEQIQGTLDSYAEQGYQLVATSIRAEREQLAQTTD